MLKHFECIDKDIANSHLLDSLGGSVVIGSHVQVRFSVLSGMEIGIGEGTHTMLLSKFGTEVEEPRRYSNRAVIFYQYAMQCSLVI
jgi:hypothetical protein